jgi:predicted transcriptional regulator
MSISKVSISLNSGLEEEVRRLAQAAEVTVSAWFAQAAEERIRRERWNEFLSDWEAEHGALSEEEYRNAADRLRAARTRAFG